MASPDRLPPPGAGAAAGAGPGVASLTHLDASGAARQVDVSDKAPSTREAVAEAVIRLPPRAWEALRAARLEKGDAIATARLAGIAAAKFTPFLIPLCHAIPLGGVAVEASCDDAASEVTFVATARTFGPTGVEMEAMTAAAVAGLTLYDMVKGVDKGAEVRGVRLLHKSGGKSGSWDAPPRDVPAPAGEE